MLNQIKYLRLHLEGEGTTTVRFPTNQTKYRRLHLAGEGTTTLRFPTRLIHVESDSFSVLVGERERAFAE